MCLFTFSCLWGRCLTTGRYRNSMIWLVLSLDVPTSSTSFPALLLSFIKERRSAGDEVAYIMISVSYSDLQSPVLDQPRPQVRCTRQKQHIYAFNSRSGSIKMIKSAGRSRDWFEFVIKKAFEFFFFFFKGERTSKKKFFSNESYSSMLKIGFAKFEII